MEKTIIRMNINTFLREFNKEYNFLYNSKNYVAGYNEAIETFDHLVQNSDNFKAFVREFVDFRQDFISSDREAAAFMFTFEKLSN